MKIPTQDLCCPVCQEKLSLTDNTRSLTCFNGHLFDRAKQGYFNLLLSQNKKSKHPGDTPDMVNARRDFLNTGHYEAIAAHFINAAIEALKPSQKITELSYCDLACGEGYYTLALAKGLKSNYARVTSTGIDISTPAIKSASRRDKDIRWLVASAAKTPLSSHTQDLVSGLFFHFDLNEIDRILKPGGYLILVNTGPLHLIELRELIYDELKPEKKPYFDPLPSGIHHVETQNLKSNIKLTNTQEIKDLLAMTPHYWRAKPEKKAALEQFNSLDVCIDIQFDIFAKNT